MADEQPLLDNTEKPIDEWASGNEPPTGAQLSYIQTMARSLNMNPPAPATKAEASELIEDLQVRVRATPKDKDIPEGD